MSDAPDQALDLSWDDLPVGLERTVSMRVTIDDVAAFAQLSGDHSPIHVDDRAAKAQGLPGIVAHGALLAARVSALIGMQLPGRRGILKGFELQFRNPLVPPADIRIHAVITSRSEAVRQLRIQITISDAAGVELASGKVSSIVR